MRRLAVTAALGLTASALLGGCGFQTRQQAAAVVNGNVIHEADVQETANQLKAAKFTTEESIVVTGLIAAPLLDDALASTGGRQPDASYASAIAAISNPTETTKAFVFAATMLQQERMPPAIQAKYAAAVKSADVSVNPKFGSFVTTAGPVFFALGPAAPSWIKPSAATSPAPTNPPPQ
ncbi:MAG: hypothetical protein ABIQ53_10290 [Terracoccus sp.]